MQLEFSEEQLEQVHQQLALFQDRMADIREIALITSSGQVVATTTTSALQQEALVESGTIIASAEKLLLALDGGQLYQVFAYGFTGWVIVTPITPTIALVVSTVERIKVALMLMDVKKIAVDIGTSLSL